MAVEFLIGRAGTGKTQSCARQIRDALLADPLGPPLLWITPQQATFTAERLLLTSSHLPGSFRAHVLSFQRLALDILHNAFPLPQSPDRQITQSPNHLMSNLARLVLLEEVVRHHRSELRAFAAVADRPGFLQKLDATLRELRQQGHSANSLHQLLTAANPDPITTRKLHDLALLLAAWTTALQSAQGGATDFETILQIAPLAVPHSPLTCPGSQVWLDAFSALNTLEINLLVALAQSADKLTITLLADPDAPTLHNPLLPLNETSLFARTERLHRRLLDAFRQNNIPISTTTILRTPHRFTSPTLAHIESALFAPSAPDSAGGSPLLASGSWLPASSPDADCEIWQCPDPDTEIHIIAQTIRDLVTRLTNPLRYRDIGLIVPDLESEEEGGGSGYQNSLRRIFTEHHIPHFIDQRRTISHHPLVTLLKSAIRIVTSRWNRDDVLLYLKTSLANISTSDVALLENYLLAHGITGEGDGGWNTDWPWIAPNQRDDENDPYQKIPQIARQNLQQVNAIRRKIVADLHPFITACESSNTNSTQYITALRDLLTHLNVESQINAWIAETRSQKPEASSQKSALPLLASNFWLLASPPLPDPALAQLHEQAFRQIHDVLSMLENLLTHTRPRSLEQFAELLTTALDSLTLGLIPPTVDQVLISSVMRSRSPDLKLVILPGALEGQFPKVVPEDPILADLQRDLINTHSLVPIDQDADRKLIEMPFFDYVALTRASQKLIITYPIANSQGKAVSPSRYIPQLKNLLHITEKKITLEHRTALDRIATVNDLLANVLITSRTLHQRRLETLEDSCHPVTPSPNLALYHWLITSPNALLQSARQRVWSATQPPTDPHLSHDLAAHLFPHSRPIRLSISQLEKFAACPLQYFFHYTLGLRPRDSLTLDTLHLGLLYHRILERLFQQIIDHQLPGGGGDWPYCDPAALQTALHEHIAAATNELHKELAPKTPAYHHIQTHIRKTLGLIVEAQRRRAAAGKTRPLAVEVTFGFPPTPQPAESVSSFDHSNFELDSAFGIRHSNFHLPPLELTTPTNHTILLTGKIDRIDISPTNNAILFDYKSSSKRTLELSEVLAGLTLQLPTYALVLQHLTLLNPLAALYIPLGLQCTSTRTPLDEPLCSTDPFFQQNAIPSGIIDASHAHTLDLSLQPEGSKSPWFKMSFNNDGSLTKRGNDLLTHADFQTLLRFVRHKITTLATALAQGQIAPAPYRNKSRSPCDTCDFTALCPFDRNMGSYRPITKLNKEAALQQMSQTLH
ncbi:MAG: exodeoxyribonuclease V subunit gamma [Phycisphaerales bacterium]|nr:exodeoxyribonuclease V subunit gamma [Phycisphaerales bacterium]